MILPAVGIEVEQEAAVTITDTRVGGQGSEATVQGEAAELGVSLSCTGSGNALVCAGWS